MQRIITLFFAAIATFSTYCQTYIQDGDRCFDQGDYLCAISKYNEAFKLASGRDKQIAEIKLTRTKWCADHIKTANQAFANRNYIAAKENYQSVLESNPKDTHAKNQLAKCNNFLKPPVITLSVSKANLSFPSSGSNERVTVTTNASSYSVYSLPLWCSVYKYPGYFIITCKANHFTITRNDNFSVVAGDKTVRVNVSQLGVTKGKETTLSVSKKNLSFSSSGGKSERIKVFSIADIYDISFIPRWCTIKKMNDYFVVTCDANSSNQSRTDWFKVTDRNGELKIYVNQSGRTQSSEGNGKCFNCPKTKDTWGITLGYAQKAFDNTQGIQLGLRIEPLFKYGFGLNTGLNIEAYSTDLGSTLKWEKSFDQYALNVPIHLEYRLNFSKWFNFFVYGGAGLNIITTSSFNDFPMPTTLDYGCGFRITHFQFNIGQSLYLGDLKNIKGFRIDGGHYQNLILSASYMF